ncbi:sugar transferase [Paenibacillus methanolicus]|uniref:Exopolysaccharide biosynthesis polyprenyl glycosylphosphotransferase n=1 Tax=Paenibacillus methanolicus TaxID=582686 RepID=A0A5S5BQ70_9BACL|nr:sugar transferase [Paenibacillus methanolicus]TYP69137.1 exopolysaccharide biosynthesis polyprenyl glycosylphosphotransferase [Paenibacillus methanolicus]
MHRSNLLASVNLLQLFADVATLSLSFFASYVIAGTITELMPLNEYIWVLLIFAPIWIFSMQIQRMYNQTTFMYVDRIVRSAFFSSVASFLMVGALFFFVKETLVSRLLIGVYFVLATVLLIGVRMLIIRFVTRMKSFNSPRVVIVSTPELAKKFRRYLAKTNMKFDVVGYVQAYPNKRLRSGYHLGYMTDLEEIVKRHVIDEVIFALPRNYVGKIEPQILLCEEMGITVRMIIDFYNLRISRTHLSSVGTFPMLTFHSVTINRVNLLIKRIIDIVGALVGLLIMAILSLFIIPAIKLESFGPAVFSQKRVGLNGRVFKIYKFRSMYPDAEERKKRLMEQNQVSGGFMFKMKDDPRVTKVGKFLRKTSLDELPQFINVLLGDMSLVGTRPPTLDEVSKYEPYHRRRLSFKPGLTGMWQVSGRSNITDFDEVVRLDTSYIDQWSLMLDLKIIMKTIRMVIDRRSGAM